MGKRKRKLTAAERRARRERKAKFMTIFINGKQKRVPRPQPIDELDVEEFILRNADPIWLHRNEMWEYMMPEDDSYLEQAGSQGDRLEDRYEKNQHDGEIDSLDFSGLSDTEIPF